MNCSEEITQHSQLFQLTYGTLFPVMVILAILGNIVNLIVMSSASLQTTSYILAKSRAMSDILTMLSYIPLLIQMTKTASAWNNYFIAFYYAKLDQWILYSGIATSTLYVTAFTIERYEFLCNPLETYLDRNHRKKILIAVIVIPFLTILLHVPFCFNMGIAVYNSSFLTNTFQYRLHKNKEIMNAPSYMLYSLVVYLLCRILPTLIIILLNINIVIEYRKISKNRCQLTRYDTTEQQRRKKKSLMLLLLGTSATFVCNTPSFAFLLISNDRWTCGYGFQVLRAVNNMLIISGCTLPVILYLAFSTDYRKAASSLIFNFLKVAPRTTE